MQKSRGVINEKRWWNKRMADETRGPSFKSIVNVKHLWIETLRNNIRKRCYRKRSGTKIARAEWKY